MVLDGSHVAVWGGSVADGALAVEGCHRQQAGCRRLGTRLVEGKFRPAGTMASGQCRGGLGVVVAADSAGPDVFVGPGRQGGNVVNRRWVADCGGMPPVSIGHPRQSLMAVSLFVSSGVAPLPGCQKSHILPDVTTLPCRCHRHVPTDRSKRPAFPSTVVTNRKASRFTANVVVSSLQAWHAENAQAAIFLNFDSRRR